MYVANVCKACHFHTRAYLHVRHSLPDDVAITLAFSIVGSRLDHCNSQSDTSACAKHSCTCCATSWRMRPYFVGACWTTLATNQAACYIRSRDSCFQSLARKSAVQLAWSFVWLCAISMFVCVRPLRISYTYQPQQNCYQLKYVQTCHR
jgi:hypothetical protein